MQKIALLCLGLISLIASQSTTPTWPVAWSATTILSYATYPQVYQQRVFYDLAAKLIRSDYVYQDNNGNYIYSMQIDNYNTNTSTTLATEGDITTCDVSFLPFNTTILNPDFSVFYFAGRAALGYQTVELWKYYGYEYYYYVQYTAYIDIETNEMVRIDIDNGYYTETWSFTELDVGTQDPNIFLVPDLIADLCIPPTPSPSPSTVSEVEQVEKVHKKTFKLHF